MVHNCVISPKKGVFQLLPSNYLTLVVAVLKSELTAAP